MPPFQLLGFEISEKHAFFWCVFRGTGDSMEQIPDEAVK